MVGQLIFIKITYTTSGDIIHIVHIVAHKMKEFVVMPFFSYINEQHLVTIHNIIF